MDTSSNLDSLLRYQYDASMTPNDARQENPSPHLTQNYEGPHQPPGAEVAGPTAFAFPWQAKSSLQDSVPQGHTNLEEDTSQMLKQLSVNFQGHEPETGLYPLSSPISVLPSPPHTSQVVRTSLPGTFPFSSWVYSAEA